MAETIIPEHGHDSRQRAADVQRGRARAAVLGVSDGLVTNVSLILGVSAAEASPAFVRLAGLASLVAGACSMAVGEYISMRAQVELLERLLLEEAKHLQANPEGARAELESSIQRAGVSWRTPTRRLASWRGIQSTPWRRTHARSASIRRSWARRTAAGSSLL